MLSFLYALQGESLVLLKRSIHRSCFILDCLCTDSDICDILGWVKPPGVTPGVQCAAVTTHLVAIRAPPQKKLDAELPTCLRRAIHGYSFTWWYLLLNKHGDTPTSVACPPITLLAPLSPQRQGPWAPWHQDFNFLVVDEFRCKRQEYDLVQIGVHCAG